MKSIIKKLLPAFLLSMYHKILAIIAMFFYGFPSNKLIVIGVTGTNGKSTVVNIIGELLENAGSPREAGGEAGHKVGWTATTNFKISGKEWLNDKKMTMLGRTQTQKFLRNMVKAKCKYAIIETSSEGIKQYRHLGINYDIVVFTNLTPEHIESHGGFENYKQAKGKLFKHLTKHKTKTIDGQKIIKTIVVNVDDKHAKYFSSFPADKKISYSIKNPSNFQATDIELRSNGSIFSVNKVQYKSNLYGHVNIYNELAAIAVVKSLGLDDEQIKHGLMKFNSMPGRFEFIDSQKPFKIMVDYAPEPESMRQLYETIQIFNFKNIIHVLGSCGGGRDVARQPVLGKFAGTHAQYVIVTNEDPYDDDPIKIIDNVASGAIEAGKILDQNLFKIYDRQEAMAHAISLAKEDDLVLITGKGCEQFICVANGKKIPWDDRKVVRELLK